MNVALDGTPLTMSTGGVRRYTEELGRALAQEYRGDEFHWISDQRFDAPAGLPGNLVAETSKPSGIIEKRWWIFGVQREMRRIGAELFHGTDFSVPYLPLRPSVLTLHDLSPWMDPNWHHAAGRIRRRTPILLRLGIPTMVITPSEAIRRAAMERFGIGPARIVTVPEAAASSFRPVAGRVMPLPYLLYVGTLEPRKNVDTIVEAWRHVRKRFEVALVLSGRRREDFAPLPAEQDLYVLGEIEERELAPLYSGAVVCLYPSHYEGFGLPVLEAMQCGAAVITSKDAAIREVSGGAALHVDARDTRGWIAAIEGLLTSEEELARRRDMGLKRSAQFTWKRTAQITREVYAEAMRRFR
jgi:glycosyltransferase involved in cell wall biosynthesis